VSLPSDLVSVVTKPLCRNTIST